MKIRWFKAESNLRVPHERKRHILGTGRVDFNSCRAAIEVNFNHNGWMQIEGDSGRPTVSKLRKKFIICVRYFSKPNAANFSEHEERFRLFIRNPLLSFISLKPTGKSMNTPIFPAFWILANLLMPVYICRKALQQQFGRILPPGSLAKYGHWFQRR